jgi:hypothetical protein
MGLASAINISEAAALEAAPTEDAAAPEAAPAEEGPTELAPIETTPEQARSGLITKARAAAVAAGMPTVKPLGPPTAQAKQPITTCTPMTGSCHYALHDWGCMHDAVPDNKGLCTHCNSDPASERAACSCACALCCTPPEPKTDEWRCMCANHKGQLRCMLPAQNSGFYRNCDPFEHGACKCHCHQCM